MLKLLPTEYWDYGFTDMIRGLIAAQSSGRSCNDTCIEIPGVGRCLPIRSGRAGIVLALKALALPPGASIGVPLYCCPVVFSAIKAAGCRPCFIDVDSETYCMSAADLAGKSSNVDAVIAVHMFGNVCDIPALQRAAPGKPIIEDCAQALRSCIADRAAGSFGEISVFSFRSGKYLSAGEGGAVHCSRADIESRMLSLIEELPAPSRAEECVHVVKTYVRSLLRTKPLWGLIGDRLWSAYGKSVPVKLQAQVVLTQIYQADRYTAIRRLSVLPSLIARQRSNAEYYLQNSTVDYDVLCRERAGVCFNRMQFPLLLASSQERDEFSAYLRKNQVSTARPYRDIVAIAVGQYGYSGGCFQAERIAETVLVIPCNYALKPSEVERISTSMNGAWNGFTGRRRGADASSSVRAIPQQGRSHLENGPHRIL